VYDIVDPFEPFHELDSHLIVHVCAAKDDLDSREFLLNAAGEEQGRQGLRKSGGEADYLVALPSNTSHTIIDEPGHVLGGNALAKFRGIFRDDPHFIAQAMVCGHRAKILPAVSDFAESRRAKQLLGEEPLGKERPAVDDALIQVQPDPFSESYVEQVKVSMMTCIANAALE
jgi:hypothetical protein